MKSRMMKKSLVAACLVSMLVPCTAMGAFMYIDSFDESGQINNNPISISATSGSGNVYAPPVVTPLTDTLFGTRELYTYWITGQQGSVTTTQLIPEPISAEGVLIQRNSAATNAALARGRTVLTIDGAGDDADLTANGCNDLIQVKILEYNLRPNLNLFFWDEYGNTANVQANLILPDTVAAGSPYLLSLPMSLWFDQATQQYVDFSDITKFQMNVNSYNPPGTTVLGLDITLDYVGANTSHVPEPSTFILLGAGLVGALVVRRRAKK